MKNSFINKVQQTEQGLWLEWNDGFTRQFHYVWLRDNAPEARHENGQKLIDSLSIPLDIKPINVYQENGELCIVWANDGQLSKFDLAWLRAHAFKAPEHQEQRPWQASDLLTLPEYDYLELSSNTALKDMLESVVSLGFSLIHHLPTKPETIFKVVDLFGYVRTTNYGALFDVKTVTNPSNLAFTGLSLGGHTDNPYRHPVPSLQLLHCLQNSAEGGDSTLVDGFKVASDLRETAPSMFDTLNTTPVTFRFNSADTDLSHEASIIETNVRGNVSGIRFNNRSMQALSLEPDKVEAFYRAYQHFATMLEDEYYRISFKLNPGDVMLFDNGRILHGRVGYTGSGKRHLQGCYADMDGLKSKLALLKRKV